MKSLPDILYSPVWLNSELQRGQNLFYKNWYDRGIRNVLDIIDINGEFYNFVDLKNAYGIRGTFLDYQILINQLPNDWKTIIYNNREICKNSKYDIVCSSHIKILLSDKKGSRSIYDVFIKNTPLEYQNRWARDLGVIQATEWENINATSKEITEVKLKDFQFKINNKILVTKSFLHKIKLIDNNSCSLCSEYPETIRHLFFECEKAKQFWNSFNDFYIPMLILKLIFLTKKWFYSLGIKTILYLITFWLLLSIIFTNLSLPAEILAFWGLKQT